MKQLSFGGAAYRLRSMESGGAWIASAERLNDGARFGIECTGASEDEAFARLAAWLTWQHEHAEALAALQNAEGDYHRTIAGRAFGGAGGPENAMLKDGLNAVAAARVRLDEIRARRPE